MPQYQWQQLYATLNRMHTSVIFLNFETSHFPVVTRRRVRASSHLVLEWYSISSGSKHRPCSRGPRVTIRVTTAAQPKNFSGDRNRTLPVVKAASATAHTRGKAPRGWGMRASWSLRHCICQGAVTQRQGALTEAHRAVLCVFISSKGLFHTGNCRIHLKLHIGSHFPLTIICISHETQLWHHRLPSALKEAVLFDLSHTEMRSRSPQQHRTKQTRQKDHGNKKWDFNLFFTPLIKHKLQITYKTSSLPFTF